MSRSSGNGLTSYPLKKIPIDLWDHFGAKCVKQGTNRRWAILMLISKFCGGTLHLEGQTKPIHPEAAKKRRQRKAEQAPPAPAQPIPPSEPSIVPDLGESF